MKITTKISFDWQGNIVEEDSYEYDGPLAECKQEDQKNQLSLQNTLQSQQQQLQNQYLGQVNSAVSPYLTGQGQGFSPQQLAAMNSQAIDTNASQYNSAGNQLRQALAARGENGQTPISGTGVAGISGLLSGKAGDLANALRTNTLNDAQQNLTNRFNAASVLSGGAQTLAGNVGTYGAGSSNALSNLTSAQANSGWNTFLKALGGGLGGGVASGVSGGIGTALSGLGKKF